MYPKELKDLIARGESSTLEFKRKVIAPEKLAKELSAFANTVGGYLLIGVDDDGTIVGIDSEKTDIEFVETVCGFHIHPQLEPQIEMVRVTGREVLVCRIEESDDKPHIVNAMFEGKEKKIAYIRVGEKSVAASREMMRLLSGQNKSAKPLTLSISDKERRLFTYLEKYEKATVKDFAKLVNISDRRAERLMVRLCRAGVLQIHVDSSSDFFTLVG